MTTPVQLIDKCRQRYNAVGDTFYSDDELYQLAYEGCQELAREAACIERVFTTPSVVGQQAYAYPTQTIGIKRVTYDGKRLDRITFRQDDMLTYLDSATTDQGEPDKYFIWNNTLYLRPLPDTADLNIQIFAYNEPQEITAVSTFEIPNMWISSLIDYVVANMSAKEKNWDANGYHQKRWDMTILKAKQWARKAKTRDTYNCVIDEIDLYSPIGVR